MRLCVFSIFCALLQQVHVQNPRNQWTLLPNVVVVEVTGSSGQLLLTCLTHTGDEDDVDINNISWMKDGMEEEEGPTRGNSYVVRLEESQGGGNYTCHGKDGSLLNHTVVLIQEDGELHERKILRKKTGQGDYLDCSAQNYNGEFHCSWLWDPYRSGKVTFVRAERGYDDHTQCSVDPSGLRWTCSSPAGDIVCSLDSSGHRLSCLDEQHCPYAEETRRISLSIYVTSSLFLVEEYFQNFYLSGIVKPDRVTISRVNRTTIEWVYPGSWNRPYSYFPLSFQVAEVRGACKDCTNPCTQPTMTMLFTDIRQLKVKRRTTVCVRAQDALCNSQWSEWSHYRQGRDKRKHKGKDRRNRGQISR